MVNLFYDSTTPDEIPANAEYAALYYDGLYKATPEQAARFKYVRWITIGDDFLHCGIMDYEQGNPSYRDDELLTFVDGRNRMSKRARVYSNRDNLPHVRKVLTGLDYLVWVATLDGNQLAPDWTTNLWGVQFQGATPHGHYDTSILYQEW